MQSNIDENTGERTFGIFEFFDDIAFNRFSVIYGSGSREEEEVYSFQGSVRRKEGRELEINYIFQEESFYFHNVCYGVMILDVESRTILCYSLHDKYDNCFEPSANSMFETFNEGDSAHICWKKWSSDSNLDNGYYDQAEWVSEEGQDECAGA